MEENKIKPCPVCGSSAAMNASTPIANRGIVWQNLYISCNDDGMIGCRTDLSLNADFDCVQGSNEVLIAAWNVIANSKNETNSFRENTKPNVDGNAG